MENEVKVLVEQNRDKLALAISELTDIREALPERQQQALDRTIRRLSEALAEDVQYLQRH